MLGEGVTVLWGILVGDLVARKSGLAVCRGLLSLGDGAIGDEHGFRVRALIAVLNETSRTGSRGG